MPATDTTVTLTKSTYGRVVRYRCDVATMTVEVLRGSGAYEPISTTSGVGFAMLERAGHKLGYRRVYDETTRTARYERA